MAAPINVTMLLKSIGNFAFGKVRRCSVLTLRLRGCMSTSSTRKYSSDEGVSKPVKRSVGRTADEQLAMMRRQPTQPDDPHMLSVAIIGTPNTGKSTLTNKLVGWRICSVSKRVHTTRRKTLALIVEGNTQIRILDTPGLISKHHGKKHHLETSLILDPERSLEEADQIAVMVDVTNSLSRCALDFRVLRLLHLHPHKKSILILNKIDLLRSRLDLLTITRTLTRGTVGSRPFGLDITRRRRPTPAPPGGEWEDDDVARRDVGGAAEAEAAAERVREAYGVEPCEHVVTDARFHTPVERLADYDAVAAGNDDDGERHLARKLRGVRSWPNFDEVFFLSSLDGIGVDNLKAYLLRSARPAPWLFHPSLVTDQMPAEIIELTVKEKLLEHLPKEIPYNLTLELDSWHFDENGRFMIIMDILCKKIGILKAVVGREGSIIRRVAEESTQELMNTFRCDLKLKLAAKLDERA